MLQCLSWVISFPGKLQNVPSVFAPGMGRIVSTEGHTPTVPDIMSPNISASEGHTLENSCLDALPLASI